MKTDYFRESEKRDTKFIRSIGGRPTLNSGSTKFNKGDGQTNDFFMEGKSLMSPHQSVTIHLEHLEKAYSQAFRSGKSLYGLRLDFGPGARNQKFREIVVLPSEVFQTIYNERKDLIRFLDKVGSIIENMSEYCPTDVAKVLDEALNSVRYIGSWGELE